jgi:catechol 2,3-dioxygenase-like lactoylglutathione lyase family enzyme
VELAGLDHVLVAAPTGCEDAARRFYGELLGLREIPKPPSLLREGGVWFEVGAQQVHVGGTRDFTPSRKGHPALRARSGEALEAIAARLAAAGADVRWDERLPGVRRFYTDDPWGNRVEILVSENR